MRIHFLILAIICVLYILAVIYENKDNLYHIGLSCLTTRVLISVPTNPTLLKSINRVLDENIRDRYQYTFIDFGSGFGSLLEQMRHKHVKLIGVELEKSSHDEANQTLQIHENIVLENKDMEKFVFPNEDIILYMYEPLFLLLDCHKRRKIYNQVIANLGKSNKHHKTFVMYVQANNVSHSHQNCEFDFRIFENHGYRLKNHSTSNLWPLSRNIYLFER
jgi:predicted RNA methylase